MLNFSRRTRGFRLIYLYHSFYRTRVDLRTRVGDRLNVNVLRRKCILKMLKCRRTYLQYMYTGVLWYTKVWYYLKRLREINSFAIKLIQAFLFLNSRAGSFLVGSDNNNLSWQSFCKFLFKFKSAPFCVQSLRKMFFSRVLMQTFSLAISSKLYGNTPQQCSYNSCSLTDSTHMLEW